MCIVRLNISGMYSVNQALVLSYQVCSVLESLEREYRRDEEWCSSEKAAGVEDKVAYIQQLINKHQEQKEAFLKVLLMTLVYLTLFEPS
jgi:hypothetical protein